MAEKYTDIDPIETQEWQDSISSVIKNQGMDRAQFLLKSLIINRRNQDSSFRLTP